jgi:D-lactate dehydrogenase (cytochrome)
LAEEGGSVAIEFAKNEEEADKFWGARKSVLRDAMGLKRNPTDITWVTDVAVPISKLAIIMIEMKEDIIKSGLVSVIGGHWGGR